MAKIAIPCAHCSGMFTINYSTSSGNSGAKSIKHTPGCNKSTRVEFSRGVIKATKKA
jgi:hypothetical protein